VQPFPSFQKDRIGQSDPVWVPTGLADSAGERDPAHFVPYRKVLPKDILAMLVFAFGVVPTAEFIDRWIMYPPALPHWVLEWPLTIRIALYLVLADLGAYWMHRLLHTRHLWRAHKWHHSPTYMYWLAGVRASVVQMTLVNLPYIAAGALLEFSPWWIFWAILLKNTFANDFMHLNSWWGNRWLEWIIVLHGITIFITATIQSTTTIISLYFSLSGITYSAPTLTLRRSAGI
jgi:sterol desaturase/sphingolipid hydroxylase (fatty acid hydroxylase superfamily)